MPSVKIQTSLFWESHDKGSFTEHIPSFRGVTGTFWHFRPGCLGSVERSTWILRTNWEFKRGNLTCPGGHLHSGFCLLSLKHSAAGSHWVKSKVSQGSKASMFFASKWPGQKKAYVQCSMKVEETAGTSSIFSSTCWKLWNRFRRKNWARGMNKAYDIIRSMLESFLLQFLFGRKETSCCCTPQQGLVSLRKAQKPKPFEIPVFLLLRNLRKRHFDIVQVQ